MKNKKLTAVVFTIFMIGIVENYFVQSSVGDEKSNKTIELFNGENLDGWYTFLKGFGRDNDTKDVFTVKDGLIKISGEEWGGIVTDKEYENYKLVVEFKMG